MQYTKEQKRYIDYTEKTCTKLIACAGSGKTRCIIARIQNLISKKIYEPEQILVMTFSRFTRDDFLNKIESYEANLIWANTVYTIDSFAKSIIDTNNRTDVSLLSYKFMLYLRDTEPNALRKNSRLAGIGTIFIDEAQDLNESQYQILLSMRQKLGITLNLIGDPNQNIYQFRNSSDRYLKSYEAQTFYLTRNFRSFSPVIDFSKHLRPESQMDVKCTRSDNGCKPIIIIHESEQRLERHIIDFLEAAQQNGVNLRDIAILAPTRGRMGGWGRSHGLCFITNVLYKAGIRFRQFYEESTDEVTNTIRYKPESDHVNILTFMGSKGLEWKYVLLLDADICLINKRYFTEDRHKSDRYLLYVACSRAIDNMFIFSRSRRRDGASEIKLNPWFSLVPNSTYTIDCNFTKKIAFPPLIYSSLESNENKVTRLIDRLSEENLYRVSQIIGFEKMEIKTKSIYDHSYDDLESNIFLGKFIENLFIAYYSIHRNLPHKRFTDIENIISARNIISGAPYEVVDWVNCNKHVYDWKSFDEDETISTTVRTYIDKHFNRSYEMNSHIIINDPYFRWFILSKREWIEKNYHKYLKSKCYNRIRRYIFNIVVILYGFETQHYFHINNEGDRFSYVLEDTYRKLLTSIKKYCQTTTRTFVKNNLMITGKDRIGEIDLIDSEDQIWDIKFTSDISLKHVLQVLLYNIMYRELIPSDGAVHNFRICILNLLRGQEVICNINITDDQIEELLELV